MPLEETEQVVLPPQMLSDIRVLELSSTYTMLAGQILGDLGADVVTVEPPAGAKGRRCEPFIGGEPGLERSLSWHALNRNKRSLTLDVESSDGRAILERLLPRFDIVLECHDHGSPLDLIALPAHLVRTQVSSFSRCGPKSAYRATDAVLMAAGGAPAMAGAVDRPPLFFPVPQAMMEAGSDAAVAALAGLTGRDSGQAARVFEIEARVAATTGCLGRLVAGRSGDQISRRDGSGRGAPTLPVAIPGMYECRDGWAAITVVFTPAFVAMTQRIARWLAEEGALSNAAASEDLAALARKVIAQEADPAPIQQLVDALKATCLRKSKTEIVELSKRHKFMAAPAMDMSDISEFGHYRERGLFASQEVGELTIEAPARFAQFSDYSIEVRRPAPRLSEHTYEILTGEAELSALEVQALFVQGLI